MRLRNIIATGLCVTTMALAGCATKVKQTTVPTPIEQPKQVKNPVNYPLSQHVKYTGSRHKFTLEATTKDGYQVTVDRNGTTRLYDPSKKMKELILEVNKALELKEIRNKTDGDGCYVELDIDPCSTEEIKEGNRLLSEVFEVTKYKAHLKYWQGTDAKGILGKWRGKKLK
jgi:hypothetical protein